MPACGRRLADRYIGHKAVAAPDGLCNNSTFIVQLGFLKYLCPIVESKHFPPSLLLITAFPSKIVLYQPIPNLLTSSAVAIPHLIKFLMIYLCL